MTSPIFGGLAMAEADQQEVQDVGGVYRRPIITLAGGGDEVTLDGEGSGYTLKPGSTGLGVAPLELTQAELPAGGSVLRHRRRTRREIFLPIDVHFGTGANEYADLEDARRRLEQICEGQVEIRVRGKDGVRTAAGFLTGGLGGDFANSSVNLSRMALGLTFDCLDPRFYGPQREESWSLSPKRTAWLSRMRDEPSTPRLVRTNYVLSPMSAQSWSVGSGSGAVSSAPDGGVLIEAIEESGVTLTAVAETAASSTARYTARVDVVPGVGVERVRVHVRDGGGSSVSRTVDAAEGVPVSIVVEEKYARSGARRVEVELLGRSTAFVRFGPPAGSVTRVSGASLVLAGEDPEPFDGNSTVPGHTTTWAGEANESASQLWADATPNDGVLAVPFGTMRLSESTVQGSRQVEIAGDADAEAVLIIDGPGEDLEVVNETTSQRIFITGDIDETLTIDSRGGWQDIYSDSMRDGEWWARVNEDAPEELITLAPGQNLIRVTMVNAHTQSKVRLLYRETYRAGH